MTSRSNRCRPSTLARPSKLRSDPYSSWANPIEAHFGLLCEFVLNNSNHPKYAVLTQRLHAHPSWSDANARAPELLAAQRRERARVRAEKVHRWATQLNKRPEYHTFAQTLVVRARSPSTVGFEP